MFPKECGFRLTGWVRGADLAALDVPDGLGADLRLRAGSREALPDPAGPCGPASGIPQERSRSKAGEKVCQ